MDWAMTKAAFDHIVGSLKALEGLATELEAADHLNTVEKLKVADLRAHLGALQEGKDVR